MSALLRLIPPLAMLLMAGCAGVPPAPTALNPELYRQHMQSTAGISAFSIAGRMALQTEQRGFSGTMRWQHAASGNHLAFFSPLGSQVADIASNAEGYTLTTSDQKVYAAQDAETLLQQTMGWSLPLQGLSHWVLGRPTSGDFEAIDWDAAGRFTRLRQHGWDIEYPAYMTVNNVTLPSKVLLKSPKLNLKLLIERWEDLSQEKP